MATKQTNSNLVNDMSALTLKEVPIAALQVHGSMGRAFTEEEKEFIKKHLDVIQMVKEGEVCTTTGTPEHSEAIFELAKQYGTVLWDKGEKGDAARAYVRSILENSQFRGLSNDIQLFNYDNNWNFLNDVVRFNDTATYQIEGMGKSTDSRQLFDKNFDLLEFAKWVATQLPRGPNMNLMDVDISEGTPYRMKIIIISCMGKTMGGGRRKKRQKYTRRKRGGRLQELGKKINELQKKIAMLEQDNEYYGKDIQNNANDINDNSRNIEATEGSLKNYIDRNIAKNSTDIGYIWSFINHKLQNYREGRPTALDDWKHHLDAQIERGEDTRELRNAGFGGGSRTRKKKKKTRKRKTKQRKKTRKRKRKK